MSATALPDTLLGQGIRHELQAICGRRIWLVLLGIGLVVLGSIMLGSPVVAFLATGTALGAVILAAGVAEVVGAFWCRDWSGFFLALLSGILGAVVGLMLLANPIRAGLTLTVLLASFLFVGHLQVRRGDRAPVRRMGLAVAERRRRRGAGVLIRRELPYSGLTIIELLVGISMIFRGISWLMIASR